jgi:outer membrane biosynthesis protein TonB
VALVEEVALESTAPIPAAEAPAPKLAEVEGPIEDAPAPLPEPEPLPQPEPLPVTATPVPRPAPKVTPKPSPKPAPKAVTRPSPKPAPKAAAKPAAKAATPPKKEGTRATGRLSGLLAGISDTPSRAKATTPPAAKAGPAVKSALGAAVRRQLKPHWKAPTGADVEMLRTELSISLAQDGRVTDVKILRTTGQTASNRAQVRLHQEQAVRAVRLAAPFKLPAEYYAEWKWLSPIGFDRRLSQ